MTEQILWSIIRKYRLYKIMRHSRTYIVVPAFALFILIITTNPTSGPLPLVLAPLFLFLIALYLILKRLSQTLRPRARAAGHRLLASTLAAIITLLLILRSLDQLTVKDSLLFSLLAVIIAIYFNRLSNSD